MRPKSQSAVTAAGQLMCGRGEVSVAGAPGGDAAAAWDTCELALDASRAADGCFANAGGAICGVGVGRGAWGSTWPTGFRAAILDFGAASATAGDDSKSDGRRMGSVHEGATRASSGSAKQPARLIVHMPWSTAAERFYRSRATTNVVARRRQDLTAASMRRFMTGFSGACAADCLFETVKIFVGEVVGRVVDERGQGVAGRFGEERFDEVAESGAAFGSPRFDRRVVVLDPCAVAADEALSFELADHRADGGVAGGVGEFFANVGDGGPTELEDDVHDLLLAGGEAAFDFFGCGHGVRAAAVREGCFRGC